MRSAKGSITKLGTNHWRVRVSRKGYDPKTGKPLPPLSENVRGSRVKAEETKLRLLAKAGEDVADSSMGLRLYVETYYIPAKKALIAQGKFKRSTLAHYEDRLRLYIYPTFGDTALKDITAPKVRNWLAGFDKPTIAKEAHKTLSSVLSFAVYDLRLKDNPCKRVQRPESARYQPHPLDLEDIEAYMYFYRDTTIEAAVLLAIGGGFRRGEMCALDVSDIDFATGEVVVDDTYIVVRGDAIDETPKSESGYRTVHLPMSITARLAEILPSDGPVLRGKDGGRMYPSAVSRAYSRIKAKLPDGVPRIPLKDLRHSSLTLAYEAGAEALALKDRGGHSNIDTTRRYYVRPKGTRDAEIGVIGQNVLVASPNPSSMALSDAARSRRARRPIHSVRHSALAAATSPGRSLLSRRRSA